jgi:hypothetical protein
LTKHAVSHINHGFTLSNNNWLKGAETLSLSQKKKKPTLLIILDKRIGILDIGFTFCVFIIDPGFWVLYA